MVRIARHSLLQTFIIAACFFSGSVSAEKNEAGAKVKWGYTGSIGPANWGQLDPSFAGCATGKFQSPINITKKVTRSKDPLELHYQSAPMVIVDDGTTELMIGDVQTIINNGHSVQLNFPKNQQQETIVWNDERYRLVEFHFHSPSETQWHGQSYPMEIHFVHQGDKGHVAVIGVLVKGGDENPVLQKIIDNIPAEHGKPVSIASQSVNPIDLMPSSLSHYRFAGSLTTPPCTEGVEWIVMSDTITASPAQIVKLRKAAGGSNARPVQPLHGRVITYQP